MTKIAEVLPFTIKINNAYSYNIPDDLVEFVKVGVRVLVPFKTRVITGLVVDIEGVEETELKTELKNIIDVLDSEPVLVNDLLRLTKWASQYYLTSWGLFIKSALPWGKNPESIKYVTLKQELKKEPASLLERFSKSENIKKVIEVLLIKELATVGELKKLTGIKSIYNVLNKLNKEGVIESFSKIKKRRAFSSLYEKFYKITESGRKYLEENRIKGTKKVIILEMINKKIAGISRKEIIERVPNPYMVLKSLLNEGLIEEELVEKFFNYEGIELSGETKWQLTVAQKKVYDEIINSINSNKFEVYLLFGVTGSGKTEIYMQVIEEVIKRGKTAIVLVPEISLTPLMVSRFRKRFGNLVAILHSVLTPVQRYSEWKRLRDSKALIAVGPRSAVFAPLENLGIIIVDEEHDSSYKQDNEPFYNARDLAIMRGKMNNIPVILGSATPSVESFYNAKIGKYKYVELPERIRKRPMPEILLIDRRKEEKAKQAILSEELKDAIASELINDKQVIVLLNKKGHSRLILCSKCGFTLSCPHCSINLVFHSASNLAKCHYCNYKVVPPSLCPVCGSSTIKYKGVGIQKVQEELNKLYPNARIERLDRDIVRSHRKLHRIFNKLNMGEIDILIGTQMIAKGHDFPLITLVAVLEIDYLFSMSDFRISEKIFSLLEQVAGRSGRGDYPGKCIIQTYYPEHYVFKNLIEHNVKDFIKQELEWRKSLKYPPFYRMALVKVESSDSYLAFESAKKVANILRNFNSKVIIQGPAPAPIFKIKDIFRWQIILKAKKYKYLNNLLVNLIEREEKLIKSRKVKIKIDIDPHNFQ